MKNNQSQTNRLRKLVCMLLAAGMILGLLPVSALEVHASGKHNVILESVKPTGSADPYVSVDNKDIEAAGGAEAGQTVRVYAKPAEGYKVSEIEVRWTEGSETKSQIKAYPESPYAFTMPDAEVKLYITSEKQVSIEKIDITGFRTPAFGDKPVSIEDLSLQEGAHASIKSVTWRKYDAEKDTWPTMDSEKERFEKGSYYVSIQIDPDPSYIVTSGTKLLVNGKEDLIDPEETYGFSNGNHAVGLKEFQVEKPKISFDANGGSGTMPGTEPADDGSYTLPVSTFTAPAGKEFDKWDLGVPGTKITIGKDTTIKAIWKTAEITSSRPEEEVSPEFPIKASKVEKAILKRTSEKDLNCSSYSLLQAKVERVNKIAIRLKWNKVKGADHYIIYGNKCGKTNKYEKLKTVKGSVTSVANKKLQKGTYYKFIIVAVKGKKAIAASKTIHAATTGGKYGNHIKVTVNKKKVSIKKKKTTKIKATLKTGTKPVKIHRKIAYESSDVRIATVDQKGKIKGIKKGTCYIYAYAQNGVSAKVKVTVK